jgi:hypothetical protein
MQLLRALQEVLSGVLQQPPSFTTGDSITPGCQARPLSSQSAVFQKGRLGYLTVEVHVEAALRKLDSTAAAIQARGHLKGAGDDILHRVKTGDNQLPWRVSIRIITKPWPTQASDDNTARKKPQSAHL